MKMTKRSLRAMRDRWKRDLDRLETAFPVPDWKWDNPEVETVRNLATAIAQIDGIIANQTIFPAKGRAALSQATGGKE